MWSIYDTMILLTGILTAAIALIPIRTIEAKTRVLSVVIGGAVILLSVVLGSLQSFAYPSFVFVAPIIPLLAAGAIAKSALDTQKHQDAAAQGQHHGTPQPGSTGFTMPTATPAAPAPADPVRAAAETVDPSPAPAMVPRAVEDGREAAWTALFDPATTAEHLAQIAAEYPEFAGQIAAHPNCYPDLRVWAQGAGGAS